MEVSVVGVTFSNPDGSSRTAIIRSLVGNERVKLERDPYNEYDRNAVKVMVEVNGAFKQIGFLPGTKAAEISPLMRRGMDYGARITACGEYMDRPYCKIDVIENSI